MATGVVFAIAVALLVVYQVAGRRFHHRKDGDKADLLGSLEGDWVVVLRKRKRALYRHEGRLDSAFLGQGRVLLHAQDCDHVLALRDVKYVTEGDRRWGPL